MPTPLILYSTQTWLAIKIAERYYGNRYYVWCTPDFDSDSPWTQDSATPPTSCPSDIYHSLWKEVQAGDLHSYRIRGNSTGILDGAVRQLEAGTIDESQLSDIASIVAHAQVRDFKPYIFIIPFHPIADLVRPVAIEDRAHPLSEEYIIDALPRRCFDIIELRR